MKARVKADYRLGYVRAFGGQDYNRQTWEDVPPGCEEEARRHPFLEIHEIQSVSMPEPKLEATEPVQHTEEPDGSSRANQQRRGGGKRGVSNV